MNKGIILVLLVGILATSYMASSEVVQSSNSFVIKVTDVNYKPSPAKAGGYIDLFLTIENQGAKGLNSPNFELVTDYPFSLDPTQSPIKQLSDLNALSSTTLYYKIRVDNNAISGNNKIKLNYWDGTFTSPTKYSTSFDVFVDSSSNLVISEVSPTTLSPGSQEDVTFKLSNVGSSPVRDLIFQWDEPNNLILPIGSDNRKYIPIVNSSDSVDVKFKMMVDSNLAPGVYPLTIKITQSNSANTTTKVGMVVGGGTDFDIGVQPSSTGELSLSISNIGVNNADSVSVNFGGESQIIGKINKGDYTLATFASPRAFSGQPGNRADANRTQQPRENVPVEITYTDTVGQRQKVTKELSSSQIMIGLSGSGTSPSGSRLPGGGANGRNATANSFPTVLMVVVIIIAIGIGLYFYRRKRKKKDEN